MIVETLIEALREMDPAAEVIIEGAGETFWSVQCVTDDETGMAVVLVPGKEVAVTVDG
jgi:hypothetical protein